MSDVPATERLHEPVQKHKSGGAEATHKEVAARASSPSSPLHLVASSAPPGKRNDDGGGRGGQGHAAAAAPQPPETVTQPTQDAAVFSEEEQVTSRAVTSAGPAAATRLMPPPLASITTRASPAREGQQGQARSDAGDDGGDHHSSSRRSSSRDGDVSNDDDEDGEVGGSQDDKRMPRVLLLRHRMGYSTVTLTKKQRRTYTRNDLEDFLLYKEQKYNAVNVLGRFCVFLLLVSTFAIFCLIFSACSTDWLAVRYEGHFKGIGLFVTCRERSLRQCTRRSSSYFARTVVDPVSGAVACAVSQSSARGYIGAMWTMGILHLLAQAVSLFLTIILACRPTRHKALIWIINVLFGCVVVGVINCVLFPFYVRCDRRTCSARHQSNDKLRCDVHYSWGYNLYIAATALHALCFLMALAMRSYIQQIRANAHAQLLQERRRKGVEKAADDFVQQIIDDRGAGAGWLSGTAGTAGGGAIAPSALGDTPQMAASLSHSMPPLAPRAGATHGVTVVREGDPTKASTAGGGFTLARTVARRQPLRRTTTAMATGDGGVEVRPPLPTTGKSIAARTTAGGVRVALVPSQQGSFIYASSAASPQAAADGGSILLSQHHHCATTNPSSSGSPYLGPHVVLTSPSPAREEPSEYRQARRQRKRLEQIFDRSYDPTYLTAAELGVPIAGADDWVYDDKSDMYYSFARNMFWDPMTSEYFNCVLRTWQENPDTIVDVRDAMEYAWDENYVADTDPDEPAREEQWEEEQANEEGGSFQKQYFYTQRRERTKEGTLDLHLPPSLRAFDIPLPDTIAHAKETENAPPSMVGARRKPAGGRKAAKAPAESVAMTAAATALLDSAPLFYSLERARFYAPHTLTKVIAIQLPVSHLRSKEAIHEYVLKKLLHRPYTLSPEERTELGLPVLREAPASDDDARLVTSASTATTTTAAVAEVKGEGKGEDEEDPYVVVHVRAIEPHADTVRQCNARGDIQLNAMVTLTVARTHHGVLCGQCEPSPYENCVQVLVPREEPSATGKDRASKKTAGDKKRDRDEGGAASALVPAPDGNEDLGDGKTLCLTVRCLAEEPVVSGQAVFVISEPGGSIRCMAIRPPRAAPGPFRLIAAVDAEAERTANGRGRGRGGAGANAARTPVPGAIEVLCDIPPKEEGEGLNSGEGRPGKGKFQKRE